MNHHKILLFSLSLIFCIGTAYGKILTNYRSYIQPVNQHGDIIEFFATIGGWSCSSSATADLSEIRKDHLGNDKRVTRSSSSDYSFNNLYQGMASIQTDFAINHANKDPIYDISVTETCRRTIRYIDTCSDYETDEDGDSYYVEYACEKEEEEMVNMNWTCNIDKFPSNRGQVAEYKCNPPTSSFQTSYSVEALMLRYLKEKQIITTIKNLGTEEVVLNFNCDDNSENPLRHLISFSQGAKGHAGENDFIFNINLNGQEKVVKAEKRDSGLVEVDIAYCTADSDVDIHIDVTEDDLFFDDSYLTQNDLTLPLKAGAQGTILLKRKNIFGKIKEKYTSEVMVKIIK